MGHMLGALIFQGQSSAPSPCCHVCVVRYNIHVVNGGWPSASAQDSKSVSLCIAKHLDCPALCALVNISYLCTHTFAHSQHAGFVRVNPSVCMRDGVQKLHPQNDVCLNRAVLGLCNVVFVVTELCFILRNKCKNDMMAVGWSFSNKRTQTLSRR